MRMWMLPTECMCGTHRAGEHSEIHKHRPGFVKGHSIAGRKGQIEPEAMLKRHDELATTFKTHKSPYTQPDLTPYSLDGFVVNLEKSAADLANRCEICKILITAYLKKHKNFNNYIKTRYKNEKVNNT